MNETFFTKIKDKFTKKAFFIELDEPAYVMPTQKGFIKPDVHEVQLAIERYCIKNNHKLEYISMEEPVVFVLDKKETYSAEAMLVRNKFMNGYAVKCTEV